MFESLEQEIASIKTPKFHFVDGPLPDIKKELVRSSELAVPASYKEFVVRFGNVKLYRQGSVYQVQVFAVPQVTNSRDGEDLIQFGRSDLGLAYFKVSLLVPNGETPVFEWIGEPGLRRTASGIEEWITKKCKAAKKQYSKERWAGIVRGPEPFSAQEKDILEARRKYRWEKIGVADNEDIQFEVFNGSNTVLPYLAIGILGQLRPAKSGPLTGGAFLPVSSILPGQSKIIEFDCYKKYVDPKDVETFAEPDPEPEDRDQYWEFKPLPT